MITVEFLGKRPIFGFHISGHSDMNPGGPEILCAAVSSVAYMMANTVTDVIGFNPSLEVSDGDMYLKLQTESEANRCRELFGGMELHMRSLMEQYPKNLKVIYSEV